MLAMDSLLRSHVTGIKQRGGRVFALACPLCEGGAVGIEYLTGGPYDSRPMTTYAHFVEQEASWYSTERKYARCPNCRPRVTL